MCVPLYEIHNATVWRGQTKVFTALSLSVAIGESIAILGPNGAGKTTLVQLLTRTLRPEYSLDGYVRIRGRALEHVWELRRQMGLVSHDLQTAAWDKLPAGDVIISGFSASLGLRGVPFVPRGEHQQRVENVAHRLEISALLARPFATLSTGQQRQVLLARALVVDPQALIFDEPTAGLDLKWSALYMLQLRRLVRKRVSLTLVTHQVHEIPPEVSRVVLIKQGEIVADGDREALLQSQPLSDLFETQLRAEWTDDGFCRVRATTF
jgi:iron complex transport system ATP-binding protein